MKNEFWIGEERMEPFRLWLHSKINLFRFNCTCENMAIINEYKDILNSLGKSYLNEKAEVQYGGFVSKLMEEIS